MALKNIIEPAPAASALARWLGRKMPRAASIAVSDVVVPAESGISAETVLFEAHWTEDGTRHQRGLVARVQPRTGGVWPKYDLEPEFKIMKALSQLTDVAVPQVLWLEQDPSILGAPFIVMERLDGRVARDDPPFTAAGWVLELTPQEQATLYDNGLQALAAVAVVDVKATGASFVADMEMGASTIRGHVGRWRDFFDWSRRGEPNSVVEAGFEWLEANMPPDPERPSLSWGDARLGNIMFSEDLTVAGMLDWELASLSYPEADLGWWLFLLRHHTEGIGLPMPVGFPPLSEAVSRWEKLTGFKADQLHYFEVFAATRLAVAMVRAAHMMMDSGQLPADAQMALTNPAAQLLAKMLGLPAPEGHVQTFIGNR